MKRIFLLTILPLFVFANSSYLGTYICNENQQITITNDYLYIADASFKYNSTKKKNKDKIKKSVTNFYLYKNEVAVFGEHPNETNVYGLYITGINKNDKTIPPYVGRCKKFNK